MANPDPKNDQNNKPSKLPILLLVIAALVLTLFGNRILDWFISSNQKEVTYDEFLTAVAEDRIKEVDIGEDYIKYILRDDEKETEYYTNRIPGADISDVTNMLRRNDASFEGVYAEEGGSFFVNWILMPLIMIFGLSLLMRLIMGRSGDGGGLGGIGAIGKSKAKVYMEKETGVTFRDVAGQDEAKESLEEIIDFLHNPKKYTDIGAKLPKGALLVGSPGTGKTLLAKAVAGEAHVPFFSISGSDIVEMFVGVGASRVRDLFKEAAKVAPAIIFIDEIDAIGRSRDSKFGGNDEREQTLNQLLAEIDGFDSSKGVVILAATNRPEILDKALLRAGRFDRRIIVDRPNLEGRYQTLQVHTRNISLSDDVDLKKIAQATAGAVGADLANLVNEAALRAVRQGRKAVNQEDLLVSFEVVIAGTEKKGTVLTDIEKRIVAYHEVGHALVAALRKHSQPVSKITIVPHTSGALGYTMQMPEEEKYLRSKQELLTELETLLGGRAAEQTVFGIQTTGAANDIQRATELARRMVTQFGMSDKIGLMALAATQNEYLDGQAYMDCAQSTAADADSEVKQLLNSCYEAARTLLQENRSLLDEIALYLLQKETITGDELMAYVNADRIRLNGETGEL
ncbi:MAG: ATP-dependent zinc metalloprotease FtsH [Oscillospiraceae bacterium]|nr:ATP-dependent zinc metalloprotease FtsH [Oscillospiraceae bacterium]